MSLDLSQFDFKIPSRLIAQEPCPKRDQSRLMVLHRTTGFLEHRRFEHLLEYLRPGDVLVANDSQVVPARLIGRRNTGGRVECLVLRYPVAPVSGGYEAPCLLKAKGRIRVGEGIEFGPDLAGEVTAPEPDGTVRVRFRCSGPFDQVLRKWGRVPLPPYIRRSVQDEERQQRDEARYQTVYARHPGSVAAPTAGLHFTEDLVAALQNKGVYWVTLTLHVGYGTFAPIKTPEVAHHRMHAESFRLSEPAVEILIRQKREGGRIVAVGTTTTRVLEHIALKHGRLKAEAGECDLFIKPGFVFRVIDGLITNFHLPRTTLLLLVSAFGGRDFIYQAYQEAIQQGYRFYSYGDAMLIL